MKKTPTTSCGLGSEAKRNTAYAESLQDLTAIASCARALA